MAAATGTLLSAAAPAAPADDARRTMDTYYTQVCPSHNRQGPSTPRAFFKIGLDRFLSHC